MSAEQRSIPAWAGETDEYRICHVLPEVYPRVGGGNSRWICNLPLYRGLSPRGRGKQRCRKYDKYKRGSIPAWAGETACSSVGSAANWVYPRVGGGNRKGYS